MISQPRSCISAELKSELGGGQNPSRDRSCRLSCTVPNKAMRPLNRVVLAASTASFVRVERVSRNIDRSNNISMSVESAFANVFSIFCLMVFAADGTPLRRFVATRELTHAMYFFISARRRCSSDEFNSNFNEVVRIKN